MSSILKTLCNALGVGIPTIRFCNHFRMKHAGSADNPAAEAAMLYKMNAVKAGFGFAVGL